MLFLTMPSADLMGKQFKVESDFITYLSMEVYAALNKAARRLERLKMVNTQADGKTTPIVFDAKIRFGQDSFGSAYDAFDRFKVMGEGERFAALARVHRRMYNIATMTSYNWNGHLDLRKEIGKLYGVEAAKAELFDILPGEDNVYVKGATRQKRVEMIRRNYKKLYTLAPHGKDWMKLAYYHLHKSGLFLSKAWDYIKTEDMNTVMQIDPEVLMGRKEQVEAGINHLRNLTEATDTASGRVTIRGALSGEEVVVNLKAFYENPPNDLKSLLPVAFAGNEDLSDLRKAKDSSQAPAYKNLAEVRPGKSDVMKFEIGDKEVQFRNYLFGRAKSWDISKEGYGNLFPALKSGNDVAKAMRILNEARGARVVTNGITLFVR